MALMFDTHVQKMKYDVLRGVARLAYEDALTPQNLMDLPNVIIPEGKPHFRCCIYKERAIISERIAMALGGHPEKKAMVEVLPIACDECPVDGIQVSNACRGCLAHRCKDVCPKDAISIVNLRAQIDKEKCVECGRCVVSCPYSAIIKQTRPCVNACHAGAISMNKTTQKAVIDEERCVSCGACVYQCPFGAITDKSDITQVIQLLKQSQNNQAYHVNAVVAPAMASQYPDCVPEQLVTAIRSLGFYRVEEAAWGADMVAYLEAQEVAEKGMLTSSCCPAFVSYVQKNFPSLSEYVSQTLSPMAQISKWIRDADPGCHVVFIGPCIAKKDEVKNTKTGEYVDYAITFEEMQALFSVCNIRVSEMEKSAFDHASYYGRSFARCGGLAEAVEQVIKELQIAPDEFELKALSCDGLVECRTALLKASKGVLQENFIEGMACEGGCIGGPGCLSHSARSLARVKAYSQSAPDQTITEAVQALEQL